MVFMMKSIASVVADLCLEILNLVELVLEPSKEMLRRQ